MSTTAGIAIDAWKLETFKQVLDRAGYTYEIAPNFIDGCHMLKVNLDEGDSMSDFSEVVKYANLRCEKDRPR